MKIAFIVEIFPSLSQTFVLNQITGLIDQGHEVDVYAEIENDSHKLHPDVEQYQLLDRAHYQPQVPQDQLKRLLGGVIIFCRYFFKDPALILRSINIWRYGKAAKSLRLLYGVVPFLGDRPHYDIIHCHFGLLGLKGMVLRDVGAISGQLVTTFHGVDMSQNLKMLGDDLYKPLFEAGDRCLPISQHWQNRLIELGCDPDKITIHRMGIDPDKFVFRPRSPDSGQPTQLISVSRLAEKKGIEYGIRAVAALVEAGFAVNYSIIGDGDLKAPLAALIEQLNVGHAIHLLGPKNHAEVLDALNQSHILLAPSITASDGNQEGIPVALMEAMAMGLPVVSTYHSGIPELVEDGQCGYLVPEQDVDSLTEKLKQLVQQPELWLAMGTAGRQKVEREYNIHRLNAQLADLFEQQRPQPAIEVATRSPLASPGGASPYSPPAQP
ncbi:glycosyltransferase [Nodosilinea sp. E11]|uniref:glycosyltransferase n=1 Tax=Nodosilinea sp. E11 TaxID=3037479 RepID=UPI002934AB99|nr:glycosyltransferase [Nodosilinea sp. E11]WOD39268.1 glycosyltransferase [Nodosilinea sp. E11]